MMDYFTGCINKQDAKTRYRSWAKKLHPDHGGSNEKMAELQRQYDAFIPREDIQKTFFNQNTATGSYRFNKIYEESFESQKSKHKENAKIFETLKYQEHINKLNEQLYWLRRDIDMYKGFIEENNIRFTKLDHQITALENENNRLKKQLASCPKTFRQKFLALFR